MDLNSFLIENWIWLVTAVFGAGGFYSLTRQVSKRLDKYEEAMQNHLTNGQERALGHDREISEMKSRLTAVEVTITAISRIENQVSDIWKHMMRGTRDDKE